MRIAFVHDWDVNYQQELDWQDGLAAALHELENRGHSVMRYVCGKHDGDFTENIANPLGNIYVSEDLSTVVNASKPDVILHWADMTRPNATPLKELGIPMALCFAGGNPEGENAPLFDHIFVESQVYYDQLKNNGYDVSIAFGTNTDLFQPVDKQPTIYDVIMPGTFALWKRHRLFASAVQDLTALACGYMYESHEQECWQDCLKNGVHVLPHVSAEVLRYLYAASKICVVTSESAGGSQRTVLEAMAMNIPVIVTDSDKFDQEHLYRSDPDAKSLRGMIDALLDGEHETDTRDYILKNWSHIQYADALEAGLEKII